MDCGDAEALLSKLVAFAGMQLDLSVPEEIVFRELLDRGHVSAIATEPTDLEEYERLRRRLGEVRSQVEALRGYTDPSSGISPGVRSKAELPGTLRGLEEEGRTLWARTLHTAEQASRLRGSVEVANQRYVVSFTGREVLSRLTPRLHRLAAVPLEDFERAFTRLREAFAARAARAGEILHSLSPALPALEEIHVRSSSLGLAVREGAPAEVAAAYRAAYESLGRDLDRTGPEALAVLNMRPMVAEGVVLAARSLEVREVEASVREFNDLWPSIARAAPTATEDAVRAATIILPLGDWRETVLNEALEFSRAVDQLPVPPGIAASLLVAEATGTIAGEPVARYGRFVKALLDRGVPHRELPFASAILAAGGGNDVEAVVLRFATAQEYLSRFNGEGMGVPAAMLAILSPQIEESLDNLRFASAEVSRYRLSLGGMENLSLGMKLLLQTAVVPSPVRGLVSPEAAFVPPEPGPAAAPLGLVGVALAMPLAVLPAISAFHETGIHRLAVADAVWHPVHTHYVYG